MLRGVRNNSRTQSSDLTSVFIFFSLHTSSIAVISSFSFFVGTLAMPSDTGFYMALGNKTTCRVQGSLIQFSIFATYLYFSMLGLFSYISISCDFKEIKLRQYEPWFHSIILSGSLLQVIVANIGGYISPSGTWCFINRYPSFCEGDECQPNFMKFVGVIIFLYIFVFLFATAMMVAVCFKVQSKARMINKYIGRKKLIEESRLRLQAIVKKQCFLFLLSLFCGFGLSLIIRIIQSQTNSIHFLGLLTSCIMTASSGIFVTIVYESTRSKKAHDRNISSTKGLPGRTTLVSDIRRSIRDAESSKDSFATQNLTDPSSDSNSNPKSTFSIFDGTGASDSPWSQFIFSEDETGSDEDENSQGPDSVDQQKQLDHNDHKESEIPSV